MNDEDYNTAICSAVLIDWFFCWLGDDERILNAITLGKIAQFRQFAQYIKIFWWGEEVMVRRILSFLRKFGWREWLI